MTRFRKFRVIMGWKQDSEPAEEQGARDISHVVTVLCKRVIGTKISVVQGKHVRTNMSLNSSVELPTSRYPSLSVH